MVIALGHRAMPHNPNMASTQNLAYHLKHDAIKEAVQARCSEENYHNDKNMDPLEFDPKYHQAW